MQVNTDIGPVFTQQQTVQPFTSQLRLFNLKEANSTENCVGGCGTINQFQYDASKSYNNLVKNYNEVNRHLQPGMLIEPFGNDNGNNDNDNGNGGRFLEDPIGSHLNVGSSPFIAADDRYLDPTNADYVENAVPQDYTYNSYADWRAPTFNQFTRIHDDNCNEENRLRIGSKPMKYYLNQDNSPQADPFQTYSIVGNQKSYDVRNEFERAVPTRLNPIYPVQVEPYATTPFLGATNPNRTYVETDGALRWSREIGIRPLKTENGTSEKNYNRYDPGVTEAVVQNAGQFALTSGSKMQNAGVIGPDGYYNYLAENHVLFGNSAVPYWGVSSRNLLQNVVQTLNC